MRCRAWAAAALTLLPGQALAHAPLAGAGDFYAGLLHPVTDPPALMTLLAAALLAGQTGGERCLWTALAGAAAAFVGGLGAVHDLAVRSVAVWHAAVILAIALSVAAQWRPPAVLLVTLVALACAALGLEQVSEVRNLAFAGGVALAVALALLYGVSLVSRVRVEWGRIALRVVGSWLVAIQALMFGLALR